MTELSETIKTILKYSDNLFTLKVLNLIHADQHNFFLNLILFQSKSAEDLSRLGGLTILVDRIQTPEKDACRLRNKIPLAVFKSGNERVLVRVISVFPRKDLLVPVPADDVPAFLVNPQSPLTGVSSSREGFEEKLVNC